MPAWQLQVPGKFLAGTLEGLALVAWACKGGMYNCRRDFAVELMNA